MKLEDYSLRLAQLLSDIEAAEENGWIRDAHFTPWVDKYNRLVTAFNSDFSRNVSKYGISETTHSKSGKTITPAAVKSLQSSIENLKVSIDETIKQENENKSRFHCFKIGNKCPHEINPKRYKFFVGMPFDDRFYDSYEYGIKTMLTSHGIDCEKQVFRADEKFGNVDIMCKICRALQESEYIIINISAENPNVMFELGLAYGLNKTVFLLKDTTTTVVSDLKGLEYIEYAHAGDLGRKLFERFEALEIL